MFLIKAFDYLFLVIMNILDFLYIVINYFLNKMSKIKWRFLKIEFSRKYQNKKDFVIQNEEKSEDEYKNIELEFFNLLKKYSINEVDEMNISYIKSFKLNNHAFA